MGVGEEEQSRIVKELVSFSFSTSTPTPSRKYHLFGPLLASLASFVLSFEPTSSRPPAKDRPRKKPELLNFRDKPFFFFFLPTLQKKLNLNLSTPRPHPAPPSLRRSSAVLRASLHSSTRLCCANCAHSPGASADDSAKIRTTAST